jgi:membrane associated rhomboid family serine protease
VIPLRDDVPSRTTPLVNVTLIVINVLAFLYQLLLGPALMPFLREFAVVPALYFREVMVTSGGGIREVTPVDLTVPLFTSMFLHGGWLHLGGNMLYLWIFGDNVEDRMGHFRYLVFYLMCGVAASAGHIWSNPASRVPSLGASGAIAGVLGAYFLLYPKARVVALLPLGFFTQLVQLPALFFLGWWFVQQFFYGLLSLGVQSAQTGGVAWWAHIGGFAAGAVLVWVFKKRDYRPVERDLWWQGRYRY